MRVKLSLGPRQAEDLAHAIGAWYMTREGEDLISSDGQRANRLQKIHRNINRQLMGPVSTWIKCKGCDDLTPPADLKEGDGYCVSCTDARLWMAHRGIDPDAEAR